MQNGKAKGEYRSLTPQEIASTVQMFRKMMDWKQLTLALEAGVDERTVQRIERGERVGDETLRRIGKALRLAEPGFVGPRYIQSPEEQQAQIAQTLSEITAIDAHEFASVKDSEAVLTSHGNLLDDNTLPEAMADQIAELQDNLTDWADCYPDLSNVEKLNACRAVLSDVQKVGDQGFRVYYGVYDTEEQIRVAVLVFRPRSDEAKLKQLVVPRRFAQLARRSLRT